MNYEIIDYSDKYCQDLSNFVQNILKTVNVKTQPEFDIVDACNEYSCEEIDKLFKAGKLHIIVENDEIIGSVGLLDNYITTLFVKPELHGQGIGKKLLKFIEEKAIENNVSKLFLKSTIMAEKFYLKNGYSFLEKIKKNGETIIILMSKELE